MPKGIPKVEFAPPGYDPTAEDLPRSSGPKLSGCLLGLLVFAVMLGIAVVLTLDAVQSAQADEPQPTLPTLIPTEAVTETPYPTYTAYPTYTIEPGRPTWTAAPTETPAPPTPTETPTVIPTGMISTWTPGPWMLTSFAGGVYESTVSAPGGSHASGTPTNR